MVYYLCGYKVDKSLGRDELVCLQWNWSLNLGFYFLNMDQLFNSHYFKYRFSTTLYPCSLHLCVRSFMFLSLGRNKALPFKQRLAADIESVATGYRCLQASPFSVSLLITRNFTPIFS